MLHTTFFTNKKNFLHTAALLIVVPLSLSACSSSKMSTPEKTEEETFTVSYSPSDVSEFTQSWGYVIQDREYELSQDMPISDIGYFINAINVYSNVPYVPPRNTRFVNYPNSRVHIVTSCDSRSQAHLLLDPKLPLRDKIVNQLIEASKTYEGLQVDWEYIPKDDKENFLTFLQELKSKLNGKILSVAVPARVKTLENDVFDYKAMCTVADKIIVMAYDEHWSTSKPGSIASMDWCKRIADYCLTVIPKEKLVMGLPFYGRTWRDDSEGGKAYYNSGINRIIRENKITNIERINGIPTFSFEKELKITCYYEDEISLAARCQMYDSMGIENIAFWRIGQEDPGFWKHIKLKE